MYSIVLYTDDHGNCPIEDFMKCLREKALTIKNDRIQFKQVKSYVEVLKRLGTRAGEEFVKHISDDIWELRPGTNRILFAWDGYRYVLLHNFQKKTNKTPKREIEKAKREFQDWVKRHGHQ